MKTGSPTGSARRLCVAIAGLAVALALSSCGITAPRGNEGFANLDSPGIGDTERTVAISLGPSVLRFAARFLDDDPETRALLLSLDGVRVRVYEIDGDVDRVIQRFERMGEKLGDSGWNPVMLVQEEGERVKMYAKTSGKGVRGLTIISVDDEDAVLVNIMGNLDPHLYGDVMTALDIDKAPQIRVAAAN